MISHWAMLSVITNQRTRSGRTRIDSGAFEWVCLDFIKLGFHWQKIFQGDCDDGHLFTLRKFIPLGILWCSFHTAILCSNLVHINLAWTNKIILRQIPTFKFVAHLLHSFSWTQLRTPSLNFWEMKSWPTEKAHRWECHLFGQLDMYVQVNLLLLLPRAYAITWLYWQLWDTSVIKINGVPGVPGVVPLEMR